MPRVLVLLAIGLYAGFTIWQLETLHSDLQGLERDVRLLARERTIQSGRVAVGQPRLSRPLVRVGAIQLDYAFLPYAITVRAGTRVSWVNSTASPHTVTSETYGLFSLMLWPHGRVSRVFRQPGTFRYYCEYHPYQHGIVTVIR